MTKLKLLTLSSLPLIFTAVPALSQTNPIVNLNNNISVQGSATYQHYQENANGHTLGKKTGWVPTIQGSGSYMSPSQHFFLKGQVTYTRGSTTYLGRNTTGQNTLSTISGSLEFGQGFLLSSNFMAGPFITYGHRYWNSQVTYNMNYIGGGVMFDYQLGPRLIISGQGLAGGTFSTSLSAPPTRTYNKGYQPIVKATLKANYKLAAHWYGFTSLSYTYFNFGKTPINPKKHIYRPSSTSQNLSIGLGVRYTF